MNNTTYTQYKEAIAELVGSILEEASDRELDHDEIYDLVHEYVDGHEWCIYYYGHDIILQHTENEEAYLDIYCNRDIGDIVAEHGLDHMRGVQAFWAMVQDVNECLFEMDRAGV